MSSSANMSGSAAAGSGGSSGAADTPHLLSLKVMRLSRPGFSSRSPLQMSVDASLPANEAVPLLTAGDLSAEVRGEHDAGLDGLGSTLTLPAAFGNIFLGETFSAYLCVNNESATPVLDLAFKAELQTSTQRFTLADTASVNGGMLASGGGAAGSVGGGGGGGALGTSLVNVASSHGSLLPAQSAEFVIHHEIKELGIHILVCSVHYTPASSAGAGGTAGGERKFFRKFYKFQVLNPLSVKTKVHTLQDGRILLEAQVQNVSSSPMYLERMSFEPSDPFTSVDLNHFDAATTLPANGHAQGLPDAAQALAQQPPASEAGSQAGATALAGLAGDAAGPSNASSNASGSSGMSVFGLRDVLGQQDTRQYLYMLSPKVANDISSRLVPGLGKLDISWRTQLGQSGRLQTSQLSRKVPTVDLFEVTVVEQPDLIFVEQPFKLKIRMRNNVVGERLRLSIRGVKNKMTNVLLRGPNDIDVGTLDGAAHTDIDLEFFSLVAGLQRITGIQVTDKISGTTRDIDSLAVVRVRS